LLKKNIFLFLVFSSCKITFAASCPLIIDTPSIANCEISEDTLEIHSGSHGEISNAIDMLVSEGGSSYNVIFQWGGSSLNTFTNSGSISINVVHDAKVILNQGAITNLNNIGNLISTMAPNGDGYTIFNQSGDISNINNYGNIKSTTASTGGVQRMEFIIQPLGLLEQLE
jgi:hypothetical protein